MAPETLTAERILAATEDVLRRYGPSKATVVDVARALGVSHGSVYRHFRTKAALREAVTKRWLDLTTDELNRIVTDRSRTAADRLVFWNVALFTAKRKKAGADPQLFATYEVLLRENSGVVDEHIAELVGQLVRIVRDGVEEGEFVAVEEDVEATARAVFDATVRFHDPVYADQWSLPGIEADLEALLALLANGLRRRTS